MRAAADAPATTRRRTVAPGPDAHPWPSFQTMLDLIHAKRQEETPGKRYPRVDYADNLLRFYNWARKRSYRDGLTFIARESEVFAGADISGHSVMWRYRHAFQEIGALDVSEATDRNGGTIGFRISLQRPALGQAVASSVRNRHPEQRFVVFRRETGAERRSRRHRPHRRSREHRRIDLVDAPPRRGGHTSRSSRSFGAISGRPSLGLSPPTGGRDLERSGRARRASVDAIEPWLPPWPSAAIEALTAAARVGGLGSLRQAARDGTASVDAVAIAAFEVRLGRPARLSRRRREQLLRSAAQADRCSGQPAAGVLWLLDRIEAADVDELLGDEPQSLAYFVVQLRQTARHWRRGWRHRRSRLPTSPAASAVGESAGGESASGLTYSRSNPAGGRRAGGPQPSKGGS